jgi:hypothetical protein
LEALKICAGEKMTIIDAIRQGLRRVSANPQLLALLWQSISPWPFH